MDKLLNELRRKQLVLVPVALIDKFVKYCEERDVYPSGGAITGAGKYFYLDD